MALPRAIHRTQAWYRRLTVPQFTVVTGLLVITIGTVLLSSPLCTSKSVGLWEALFTVGFREARRLRFQAAVMMVPEHLRCVLR